MVAGPDSGNLNGAGTNPVLNYQINFATTGLQQITSASASLQQAAASFDRVLGEMQQSPQGLLAKPPAQEIEVKP